MNKKEKKEASQIIHKMKENYEKFENLDAICKETGFVDWNTFSMDELADYLENKWAIHSSGEAFAIMRMVDFYRENKK
jgi:hypothetical protein